MVTNFEKMVAVNRGISREKIDKAKMEIDFMLKNDMEVCVSDLVKRTGLSRGFFYKNEEVNEALERARDLQKGKRFHKPQEIILNKAMEHQLAALQRQVDKLQAENKKLKADNEKLQSVINKRDLILLKAL